MRYLKFLLAPILSLSLLTAPVAVPVTALFMTSCAALDQGADPVVVRAEQTTTIAYNSFEAFKKYEFNNRATLESLNPAIESYANYVRRNEQKWLRSARAETMAYKYNRSGGHANLDTAVAVLQEAINQIAQYMSVGVQ